MFSELPLNHDAEPAPILLVDDNPANIIALETILDDPAYHIVTALSGIEALRRLMERDFAVLLLDVRMPGMDGFELARTIKQRERTRHTPIVFLTAEAGDPSQISEGYASGAVDYIQKPLIPEVVRSKVRVFVSLFQKEKLIKKQAELLLQKEQAESRRRISALSRANEEKLRDLLEAMPQLVWLAAPDGSILLHNERWSSYSGLGPDAAHAPGRVTSVLHPADARHYWERWELAQNTGSVFECEARLLRASDGAFRWHLCRAVPHRLPDGSLESWLGTYTDIHAQKSADLIKDEFLATLSHELRTPLNVILGWLNLLQGSGAPQIDLPHVFGILERNTHLQIRLINDLLDLSRIVTGKLRLEPRPTSLAEVVRASAASLDVIARNKAISLDLSSSPEAEGLLVFGDASRLQQAVWNVLSNAIKYTPRGGKVDVNLSQEGEALRLSVRDTGEGITPQFLPYVFDRFRQEDSSSTRSHGGLGLGLAIVRQLLELHGGKVWAQSEGKGKGSLFVLEMPVFAAKEDSIEAGRVSAEGRDGVGVSAEGHQAPRLGARAVTISNEASPLVMTSGSPSTRPLDGVDILLVDDSLDTIELFTSLLSHEGALVRSADSAAGGLEAVLAFPPHVLVSDIGMPEESGFELVARIRALQKNGVLPSSMATIALSAYARDEDARRSLEAGFDLHLTKPVDTRRLVQVIASLAGETGRAEIVAKEAALGG